MGADPMNRRSTKGRIYGAVDYVNCVNCGYHAIHKWMNRHFPRTGRCEMCAQQDRTHYASARHDRYTRNRADWFELCPRCHLSFDGYTGIKGKRRKLCSPAFEQKGDGCGYRSGADHARWRGTNAGIKGIHQWVNKTYPRQGKCENCGRTDRTTMYASIDHVYSRNRLDWLELCLPCHRAFDAHGAKVSEAKKASSDFATPSSRRRAERRAERRAAERDYWLVRLRELRPERTPKGGDAF